jgi:Fe-S-cluster containining protein
MSAEEDRRLLVRGVAIPSMVDAVAAVERGEDYYCPALADGRCTVYEDRPTICRLWGAAQSMPCPHGCTPADALTQEESHELLRQAGEAGGGMAGRYFRPGH